MGKTSERPWKRLIKTGWLLSSLFFLWGCVAGQQQGNTAVQPDAHGERILISMASMSDQWGVRLTANEDFVYTAIKQEVPRGVVLYLPETAIGGNVKDMVPESGPVTFMSARPVSENAHIVRIELLVKQDFEYEVIELAKELQVLFSMASPEINALDPHGPANAIDDGDENLAVAMDAQGNTVIFTQESLPLDSSISTNPVQNNNNQNLQVNTPLDSSMVSGGITPLTDINFTTTDTGVSTILIKTGIPVEYDLQRDNENEIKLFLKNTKIPKYHQRPLITTYFNSAVERVLPVQSQGDHNASHVLIQLRHRSPYRITRDANLLSLVFDPAPITPPEFNQARVVLNKGIEQGGGSNQRVSSNEIPPLPAVNVPETETNDVMNSPVLASGNSSPAAMAMETPDQVLSSIKNPSKYTGEKISLDFYETDIKNVFRILRTISGENFAIDKDVTGNVTLALDQPVPWDQVLDLILKMNGLGKVREYNIIRIATQKTLTEESKFDQEAMAAKQRALTVKQELEPLITEYIPINYSEAITDIEPHLKALTKGGRGSVSTNERTNTIIFTDVQQKIDEAKDLIHHLDKVTPQIMIEARVVEVSKDFSREIGMDWGMSSENVYRDDLGGSYGFEVAMNYPAASASFLDFTFDRIVGTPFSINAKLTAAEAKGDVKIVSSPRILTLDNKKATITQGLEYPYQVVEDDSVSTEFKDIDLTLDVTPHVTPDGRVSMQLFIEKNDITGFAATGEPVISSNEATTELLVEDGNTIVIGGVLKRTTSEQIDGFPFLSDIPILGYLFRKDKNEDSKNELLIFLTPTIVQLEQKTND